MESLPALPAGGGAGPECAPGGLGFTCASDPRPWPTAAGPPCGGGLGSLWVPFAADAAASALGAGGGVAVAGAAGGTTGGGGGGDGGRCGGGEADASALGWTGAGSRDTDARRTADEAGIASNASLSLRPVSGGFCALPARGVPPAAGGSVLGLWASAAGGSTGTAPTGSQALAGRSSVRAGRSRVEGCRAGVGAMARHSVCTCLGSFSLRTETPQWGHGTGSLLQVFKWAGSFDRFTAALQCSQLMRTSSQTALCASCAQGHAEGGTQRGYARCEGQRAASVRARGTRRGACPVEVGAPALHRARGCARPQPLKTKIQTPALTPFLWTPPPTLPGLDSGDELNIPALAEHWRGMASSSMHHKRSLPLHMVALNICHLVVLRLGWSDSCITRMGETAGVHLVCDG